MKNRYRFFTGISFRHMGSKTTSILLVFFMFLLFSTTGWAQNATVNGTVVDASNGEPLPGVNILVKGTTIGTSTDQDGQYSLNLPSLTDTLVVSYIGFQTKEIAINKQNTINISLTQSTIGSEELVVVGYGSQRRRDVTGSISSVSSDEFQNANIGTVDQAMQGRMAGVNVHANSHAPGGGVSVQVRGVSSLTSKGEPLYIVDGMPIATDFQTAGQTNISRYGPPANPLNSIDPSNIASIDVLKDASATSIYGSRGSNGVVIINTKRGVSGQQQINFKSNFGFQQINHKMDLLNAKQHAILVNEAAMQNNQPQVFTDQEVSTFGEGTDWQDQVFQVAPTQKYNLTFSGGSEELRYNVSGNYSDQGGIIKGSNFERYGANVNLDGNITDRFTLQNSFMYTTTINQMVRTGSAGTDGKNPAIIAAILTTSPTIPARNSNGQLTNFSSYPLGDGDHPLVLTDQYERRATMDRLIENISGELDILKGLAVKIRLGIDIRNWRFRDYAPIGSSAGGQGGQAQQITERTVNLVNENTVHYNTTIKDHKINLTGGFGFQQQETELLQGVSSGFPTDFFGTNALQVGGSPEAPISNTSRWRLISYFGRVNYQYNDKYLLTSTLRTDGSSKFGVNNKFGVFPSVAIGWRIGNEDFMERLEVFSHFKVKASYGIVGNEGIGVYQSKSNLEFEFGDKDAYIFNGQLVPIVNPDNLGNPDLSWEEAVQWDLGLNMGLFDDRLNFTVDYFHNESTKLLLNKPIPKQTGYESALQNIGSLENKGLEIGITSHNIAGNNFNWTTNFNISFIRNKILSLGGLPFFNTGDISGGNVFPFSRTAIRLIPGQPVGTYYGSVQEGIWHSQEEIDRVGTMPAAKPGDLRFKDINGDGIFDSRDDKIIGDPNPDFSFGFTNNFSYRRLNLYVFLYGQYGNDVLNIPKRSLRTGTGLSTVRLQRWTPQQPNNSFLAAGRTYPTQISTDLVEDGSFLRAGNITLSYAIPVQQWQLNALRKARVALAVDNAFTITNYSGFDPEVNAQGGGRNSNIIKGIDRFAYPVSRTFRFEIELGF